MSYCYCYCRQLYYVFVLALLAEQHVWFTLLHYLIFIPYNLIFCFELHYYLITVLLFLHLYLKYYCIILDCSSPAEYLLLSHRYLKSELSHISRHIGDIGDEFVVMDSKKYELAWERMIVDLRNLYFLLNWLLLVIWMYCCRSWN